MLLLGERVEIGMRAGEWLAGGRLGAPSDRNCRDREQAERAQHDPRFQTGDHILLPVDMRARGKVKDKGTNYKPATRHERQRR